MFFECFFVLVSFDICCVFEVVGFEILFDVVECGEVCGGVGGCFGVVCVY